MAEQRLRGEAWIWGGTLVILLLLVIHHYRATRWRVIPKNIPWIPGGLSRRRMEHDAMARTKAHLGDFNAGADIVQAGYDKYSKAGKPFMVPSFITWQPEVVLPPDQIRWLVEQPETVLSIDRCLLKDLEFPYTSPAAWSFTHPFHIEAINKLRLDSLIADMAEEVQAGIDEQWGVDAEDWTTVNIERTMMHVLVRITSRVFVGRPLCRDKEYIDAATNFMAEIGPRAALISLSPELARPVVAWYLCRALKRWNQVCADRTMPLIKQEMVHRRPSDRITMPPPKTLLEQLSRLALRSTHGKDNDPFAVASRLLALNFVAVHTSIASLINCLVDVVSPPATTENIFSQLRAEAEEVTHEHHGQWSKTAIGQLEKIDSTLRESMRLNTFRARGVERIVVKPGGVVLPLGQYLPEGTKIGMPVLPIHRDPDFYDEADRFDAFRFCDDHHRSLLEKVADTMAGKAGSMRSDSPTVTKTDSPSRGTGHVELINTSENFLAFGHGKHACPGRFLAAYELKLIMAYITTHYEIEPFSARPANKNFSDFSVPGHHDLRIRRRKLGERDC